ncbi:hypothetical protein B566_EDAN002677 [Ephemera danica]|nr:hypothetical protein B566_EDAN002677 [Ephemera danica]
MSLVSRAVPAPPSVTSPASKFTHGTTLVIEKCTRSCPSRGRQPARQQAFLPPFAMAKRWCFLGLLLVLVVNADLVLAQGPRERPHRPVSAARPHPCEQSSCYPATGNLLIGRESRLYASSTCGLYNATRYCIVSHLEDRKKCFLCNSGQQVANRPELSHRIDNIVNRHFPGTFHRSWWQSENGKENVTIQLDLEAEFHFTHLIITFKTFRPAAMLIERSYDFGHTWQVYRYFAYNCDESFPGAAMYPPKKITDVVCTTRYSSVAPSTDGEVIFRVLPQNLRIDDPYSQEVQNLLKMTNLRINFTKLHTLGDDLLDNRQEIQEKYYYAIYDMVVRGSCSCYGHASRCLPLPNVQSRPDMVHGRCECTHNTKGLNCEQCKDFYNDLPWKPAIGKQSNACKMCQCNNHTNTCHFDGAVYERSGRVSGGVCDGCQHNTMGLHCEECKPFFYHDSELDITDPYACQPCDCDDRGSLDDGICDSRTDLANDLISGRCHCKKNVDGRRCDKCTNACTCNSLGTINNQGCNVYTGECTCKRYVTGRDCNQCLPQYYGLSDDRDGCKPCDCDPGGSLDNNCDVITGQCTCRTHVTGRTCSTPEQSFFTAYIDYNVYEAEFARGSDTCQVVIREPYRDGQETTWTGVGFMRAFEDSYIEFEIDNIRRNSRTIAVYPEVCLEAGKKYKIRLEFKRFDDQIDSPSASVLIDSITLVPRIEAIPFLQGSQVNDLRRQEYERYRCGQAFYTVVKGNIPDVCKKYHHSIGFYVHEGAFECQCDPTGSISLLCGSLGGQCQCKPNVVGRRCNRCAPGTYGFGPEGCRACDCNSIGSLDNFCETQTGQCKCRPNTYGRQCDQCQPGFWNFPNCQRCECNGHADTCDSRTGTCDSCRDYTLGHNCDRCIEGYYGDPRIGIDIQCRPCPCPGTVGSGHSYASRCSLDQYTQDVVCECEEGYAGPRCDVCGDNYYGNPETPGGSCRSCNCSNNIDISRPGNCDANTGECKQCLFNTEGFNCEVCKAYYYECLCDILGSDKNAGPCNRETGQCPCLPNVVGLTCDQCKPYYWKIASGIGCEACACDEVGSYSAQCNQFDGQCECKEGFGGRQCNQCQKNYWGNPTLVCQPCNCNLEGSATMQCHRTNGSCVCLPGIGGDKCDECARGYLGNAPHCRPCGECFDNWDRTLGALKDKTYEAIHNASEIKQTGATGAYTREFENMEKKLDEVRQLLENTTVSSTDLEDLELIIEDLRKKLTESSGDLEGVENKLENTTQRIYLANLAITNLRNKAASLKTTGQSLKENATKLQEANVEGALNLTREAQRRSHEAQQNADDTKALIDDSERHYRRTEGLIGRSAEQFRQTRDDNDKLLKNLSERLDSLEEEIPELNEFVCDKRGDPCDQLCGGAGCGLCGGISCEDGAVTKADGALDFATDADKNIKDKEARAEELLRGITQAKQDAVTAKELAVDAHELALLTRNRSESTIQDSDNLLDEVDNFLKAPGAKPAEIRKVASEVLKKNIQLQPAQITELAQKINDTIASLTNIDAIIAETSEDLDNANQVKKDAGDAKDGAEDVLQTAQRVVDALQEARDAQDKADEAIEKANDDIATAEKDLTQIASETTEAQQKSNETVIEVDSLQIRLKLLQTRFLKNDRDAREVAEEASTVAREADVAQQRAAELQGAYYNAEQSLNKRAGQARKAQARAAELMKKASELSVGTFQKMSDLKGIESVNKVNEDTLNDLSKEIMELNKRMSDYLQEISEKSDYYRTCVS